MSSIMRARNALPGRGEEAEVIGGPLRAEGCWTFNARDQMPRSSPLTAHPLTATAKNAPASTPPSRESGIVRCPVSAIRRLANKDCWEQPYPDELRLATVWLVTCLALQALIREGSLGYTVPPESPPDRLQPPVRHLGTPPRLGVARRRDRFPSSTA